MMKTAMDNFNINLKKGQAVAFDFDGVIHKYRKGWSDGSIYDTYNEEVIDLMLLLMRHDIPIFILSTRSSEQILNWWEKQEFKMDAGLISPSTTFWNNTNVIGITKIKLPAQLYVDDRAYNYHGQTVGQFINSLSNNKRITIVQIGRASCRERV